MILSILALTVIAVVFVFVRGRQADNSDEADSIQEYFVFASPRAEPAKLALEKIDENWYPGSAIMLLESSFFAKKASTKSRMVELLKKKTGQDFGSDLDHWYAWVWSQEYDPHPRYVEFKKKLYSPIDARFTEYFESTEGALIRLDEVRWGGVPRDGIPPLKDPKMIAAPEASYLADSDVVFGVILNGDARCYPKRILAWHEMFKDTIGGETVCGAY